MKPCLARTDSLIDELERIVLCVVDSAALGWSPFHLCLSGGVDSSLLLAVLDKVGKLPEAVWTFANTIEHPDYLAAQTVAKRFSVTWEGVVTGVDPAADVVMAQRSRREKGDDAVWTMCQILGQRGVMRLLCTDGVDELVGGYWGHKTESDFTYFLGRLWGCHLRGLLGSTAQFGIAVRFPFLDPEFADFATRLPLQQRTRGKERKVLWRRLAARYLPPEIVERRKYGQCDMLSWE